MESDVDACMIFFICVNMLKQYLHNVWRQVLVFHVRCGQFSLFILALCPKNYLFISHICVGIPCKV